MDFHWSLSDSKSPKASRTLLSILSVLSNAVVWIVCTRPSTSKSSCPFNNPLVIVSKGPITTDIIVTIMFHSFFQFPSKVEVLNLLFTFFHFYSVISQIAKSTILQIPFFMLIIIRSGVLAEIRWSVCTSKGFICVILLDSCWVVHIPFVRMVEFKLFAHLPVDHFAHPIVFSLVLFLG